MQERVIFHLTIPINDIAKAKEFYSQGLNCQVGRENQAAVIFNFYGTQLVAHMTKEPLVEPKGIYPRHLGLILPTKAAWEQLKQRSQQQQLHFYQQPKLRFPGQITEHHVFFLQDPFYNLLEFKYYLHQVAIFDSREIVAIGDR